jgi:subtilisin family serine protease
MRKMRSKKMINVMTAGVLTTSLFSASLIPGDKSFAETKSTNSYSTNIKDIDHYIKNISNSDRDKIHNMQEMNFEGLKISPNVNLNDIKPLNVIVQFKQAPTEVDFKTKQSSGLKASIEESRRKVEESHKKFKEQLKGYAKLKSVSIKRDYKHAFNGVSMTLPANQIRELLSLDTVLAVWEDKEMAIEPSVEETIESTNSSAKALDNIEHVGATKLHKEGVTGKGIKVGVIDTGIDYTHPDLKDVYKGGFDFANNDTDPMETTYEDWKLSNLPEYHQLSNASYWTNHGTHVSGIIAGTGKNSSDFAITGVAPEVELYGYKVLGPYGTGLSSVIMAGIDEAVKDKMDVINLSLGSDITDPLNPLSVAINNATLAGTVAVLAAGNDGAPYTIGNPASSPLGITVGATTSPVSVETSNGVITSSTETFNLNDMRLMALNYQTDLNALKGSNTPIVYVEKGELHSYWDKDVRDRVVLIERGNISLNEKMMWARENGAKAVIMYNNIPNEDYIPYYFGYSFDFIPTFSILNEQGTKMAEMLKNGEVNLTINEFGETKMEGDQLADFSSRGPSRRIYDIKPEVTAPGVGVFSSVPAYSNGEGHRDDYQHAYARFSGTSMAAPHVAGAAALILQSHPEYTPEDVKLALMNTADELNGSYSVFEKGAGRIDVYEAVHSAIQVGVKGEIPTIENGEKVLIPETAGDLAYGPIAESKKDYKIKRNMEVTNRSATEKVFDVKVQFNTIGSVSQDAVKNGISLDIPTEVAVKAKGTSTIRTNLHISKDAELGLYEGYIYLTNKADSSEVYQIPLGFKKLKEGIQEVLVPYKSFATRRDLNNGYMGYTPVLFSFSSRMESFDIVLKNADTGEALGIIDAYHGYVNEDILVGLEFGFVGLYFPFTGNKDQPVSLVKKLASPGRYEIEIVSTNEDGEVFKKSQQVFIDNTLPEVKMNIPGGVYEVDDHGLKISGSIYDSNVDVMNKYGFNFNQSSNKINAISTQPFDYVPLTIDSKGNFEYERAIQTGEETTNITLQTFDNAINGMQDHPDFTYNLVKKGTPYTKLTSDKNNVKYGDSFKVTFSEHNIKDLMGGEFTLSYSNQVFELQGVELTSEFVKAAQSKGLTANLSKEETTMYGTTNLKLIPILEGANPSSGIMENLPLANLTFKVKENPSTYAKWIQQIDIISAKAYLLDQEPISINKFGQGINVLPTYSVLEGGFLPDGFIPPGMVWLDEMKDYSKVGAEVFMIGEDGKRYDATINPYARFSVKNLPLINQSYELVVKVSGHFERHTKIDELIDLYEGKESGKLKYIFYGTARAGDVNNDKVIDILDAVYISEKLKTNDRKADINYDGIVDVKDMQFVKDNYMLLNPDFTVHKQPVTKYKGKVLEDILKPLGIN